MENEILEQMGRKPIDRKVHLETWGQSIFEAIKLRSPGVNVAEFKKLYGPAIERWVEQGHLDVIAKENDQALKKILKAGMVIYVLTSRNHSELKHFLEPDHLLYEKITAFYYRDNMEFHKPDPKAFDKLLQDHNIAPDDSVYIGDSIGDAIAAKQAGLHFVACLESGLKTKADFDDYSVDAFVDKFSDIASYLTRN